MIACSYDQHKLLQLVLSYVIPRAVFLQRLEATMEKFRQKSIRRPSKATA